MGVIVELVIIVIVASVISSKKKSRKASQHPQEHRSAFPDDQEDGESIDFTEIAAKKISEVVNGMEQKDLPKAVTGMHEKVFSVPANLPSRPGQSRQVKELCGLFGEDRKHDWMAKQLREERRHMVWNNFQDLGARHELSCAAQEAREAHHREHQSGVVDDGLVDE